MPADLILKVPAGHANSTRGGGCQNTPRQALPFLDSSAGTTGRAAVIPGEQARLPHSEKEDGVKSASVAAPENRADPALNGIRSR